MSLSALADEEIIRTSDPAPKLVPLTDVYLDNVIANLKSRAGDGQIVLAPMTVEAPAQKPPTRAFDALIKFIPTESITLYLASTAALESLKSIMPWLTPVWLYWIFVGLTPTIFLLIHIGKRRSQNLRFLPKKTTQWPWWKLVAATVAFMVWALPISPFLTTEPLKNCAAIGAMFISLALSLLSAVIEPTKA